MAPKIIAAVLTLIADLVAGLVILFTMLLAMNGYSESDAMWGLISYAALTAAVLILMSVGSFILTAAMIRKQYSPIVAVLISAPAFTVLGVVLEIASSLIGVGVAEFVRVNH